jgi:hypothetical protein
MLSTSFSHFAHAVPITPSGPRIAPCVEVSQILLAMVTKPASGVHEIR